MAKRLSYLVDDLGYAKTFYPRSNTIRYLNTLAARIYLSIYKNRRPSGNRLIYFVAFSLPMALYRSRRYLLFSLLFFLAFVGIGILSAAADQTFIRAILGNDYVDLTEHNIANGDPFGIYKQHDSFVMFLYIARRNIGVSFNTFMGGLLASVGTLYLLFFNGILVGAFEYLFFKHGLGTDFLLVVFIHGTLELSAIVIAGAAGLRMGNSFLFPGTFTRLQSLKAGAKDGIKIIVGLLPVFIVAAFFEGYITRHTEMPLLLSLSILIGSLSFILWYFVYLPYKVARILNLRHEDLAEN
jgi:uncharacterized membrane protein SpoIIM required for sporulation